MCRQLPAFTDHAAFIRYIQHLLTHVVHTATLYIYNSWSLKDVLRKTQCSRKDRDNVTGPGCIQRPLVTM